MQKRRKIKHGAFLPHLFIFMFAKDKRQTTLFHLSTFLHEGNFLLTQKRGKIIFFSFLMINLSVPRGVLKNDNIETTKHYKTSSGIISATYSNVCSQQHFLFDFLNSENG